MNQEKKILYIALPILCIILIFFAFFSSSKALKKEKKIPLLSLKKDSLGKDKDEEMETFLTSRKNPSSPFTSSPKRKKNVKKKSKKNLPEKEEKPLPPPQKGKTLLSGKWGSGKGQFGKGSNDGERPKSFLVDSQGRLIVLDQENYRIQIFDSSGKFLRTIALTSNRYDLMVQDRTTSRLALYNNQNHKVEFFDLEGGLWQTISLSEEFEPVTDLVVDNGTLYLERGNNQYYRYDSAGPLALPGRPVGKTGAVEIIQKDLGQVEITYSKLEENGRAYRTVWTRTLPLAATEITSYQTDGEGNLYILSRHYLQEESQGKKTTVLNEMQMIKLDSQGNYLGDVQLASPNGNQTQKTNVSSNGSIYQMTTSSKKLRISSFSLETKNKGVAGGKG